MAYAEESGVIKPNIIGRLPEDYVSPTYCGEGNNIPLGHIALNIQRVEAAESANQAGPTEIDKKYRMQEWEQLVDEGNFEEAAKIAPKSSK